ncbi:MAG TPA: error-prone DNA polymerase [Candidatus Corynebacterium gallistercoris]|uniref:Error-prone DNA polymerase n=1 Tax=Candidatus Corynebacterium gallistercoris TaxID=2838530 RepID=A0A9D1UQE1_9CORY|nr:error-prone DNA polymerase [Candidatus Corynebacterium gallistercoris]
MSHHNTYRFSRAAPLSWSQLERILSGKEIGGLRAVDIAGGTGEKARIQSLAARQEAEVSNRQKRWNEAACQVPFAELHACSAYSFLRGASTPEEMVEHARELGLAAVACLDRDGFYGAPRLAMAAAEAGVNTVFGAELSVNGKLNHSLTVLCRGQEGYRRLSRLITKAAMADRDKDTVIYPPLEEIAAASRGEDGARGAADSESAWIILLDWNWIRQPARAKNIVELFGEENCVIELAHTMDPANWDRNVALHAFAQENGLREIVSAQPSCATPASARLAGVKSALHRRKDISAAEPFQHPTGGNWLRSGEEMLKLAGDCPWLARAVTTTVEIAEECAFTLNLIAPQLPHFPVPEGHTEMSWLREVTERGGTHRYGPRTQTNSATAEAWRTIDKELATIEALGFPGYFLIVHDIVSFCHDNNIFCQGRGSAANSAVCFALGITTVDAVAAGLLFERFLSPERDGPPDIDLDIESGRREEAIQYVYSRYGRDNAAQVANVITYRRKGAVRDAARALGYAPGQVDAWTRGLEPAPEMVEQVAEQLLDHPRHLGIHSGGMVICDRAIADVVPTEWARMDNRSVVQWDKDDCAAVGLVKFDLLGLGMLEAIHHAVDQVATHRGRHIELWRLDPVEREVYAMLCRADAVGVFQVESRAQMNTLPRLKPRTFFDLVVQVALIRPGPIQGGSVHPFIRRRNGEEPVTFDHPCLQPALEKTLGIPLFQEQLMQVVVDAAGFSGAEADTLRRAMGSKRSSEKMERLRARFYQGLAETNGITGEVADTLWNKIVAFAAYGFPESHAQSFASLVYYSAWFKYHYPAEFCVALLRAQPMGFYSPQSLIADARRHGVRILPVDINESYTQPDTVLDEEGDPIRTPRGIHGLGRAEGEPVGAIRLGLAAIGGIGEKVADKIVEVRERIGRFAHVSQLSREVGLTVAQVEHLAKAGALDSLGMGRRQAVWAAGIAATEQAGMLPETSEITAPALPGMNAFELAAADLAATGMTPAGHPVELLRSFLQQWHRQPSIGGVNSGRVRGGAAVVASQQLKDVPDGTRIRVAGVITHRQAPRTAGGVVFMGLEDETGLANVIVPKGLWNKQRVEALSAKIVVIRGIVHNASGAASVTADLIEPVEPALQPAAQLANSSGGARDFR